MTIFQLFQRTIYPLLRDSSERVFKNYPLLVLLFFFNVNLYSQHYAIKSVELGDIEINRDFDSKVNYGLISNYKSAVDVVMSQILGKSAVYMDASRPESLLSNWVADVMLNIAVGLGWNVDFALCNIGGLRSYMPKGHIVKWGKMHVLSALSVYVWNILVNNQYG